jgi:molybdate transport system substrate-binding protein
VTRRVRQAVVLAAIGVAAHAQPTAELHVFAAGSLRAALTEVARSFERSDAGHRVVFTFGASGLLKDRIAAGERADVFASANMAHPQALAAGGRAGAVRRFARNAMCALVAQGDADVFITYCTNAAIALDEQPGLRVVAVPDSINVSADYGVAPISGASAQAQSFVDYLLGANGQAILARHGFAPG